MIGFININKKIKDSSAFVVSRVKRKLGLKCGHMGTLDPLATGVLPVAVGKATRLFDFLLSKEKIYVASFAFGYETATLDSETEPVKSGGAVPTEAEIKAALNAFKGEIMQIPPIYSAKSVDGVRSYKLARRGVEVELEAKKVVIDNFELLKQVSDNEFSFKITCRGGTYIRSLARDLALKLGTFGTMTSLERVKSGIFTIENSVSLQDFLNAENPSDFIIKPEAAIDFEKYILQSDEEQNLFFGRDVLTFLPEGLYRLYDSEGFIGVGEVLSGHLKIKAFLK